MIAPTEDRPLAGDAVDEASDRDQLDRRTVWRLGLGLALVPLVISAVTMFITVGNSWYPWSDWAAMEMFTRDVGHHPVLVGLYSRDGWSHPGPILSYLMAVPYRLSGDSSVGLQLGALLINGSAIVGMAAVARRRGGTPLLLSTLLGCALVVHTMGPDFVRDPWVCYVTVIPFGLMVLLSWSMVCGDTWALPFGAALASALAQTHIGYVALAFPLLALGALALVWRAVQAKRSGDPSAEPTVHAVGRVGVIATVVTAVLWVPPVIDQLIHHPGNLSTILHRFDNGDPHTLAEGFRVVGAQFGWPPEWLTHHRAPVLLGQTPFLSSAPLPVLLLVLAAAGVVLWRRRATDALRLLVTVVFAVLVGMVAVARTVGIAYDYRLRWTWILGMLAFVVVVWTVWMVANARFRFADRRLVIGVLCALGVLSAINSVTAAQARISPVHREESTILQRLVPQVIRALPDRDGDVIIRSTSPNAGYYQTGLLLRLERDGYAARVEDNPGNFYGRSRNHHAGDPVRARFTVASDDDFDRLAAHPGDLRLLAYGGTETRARRARSLASRAAKIARLDAERKAGRIDGTEYLRRSLRIPQAPRAVGVFEHPDDNDG